jgi:hypothetical protein
MKRPSILALAIIVCLCAAGLLSASALGVSLLIPPSFKLTGKTTPSKLPGTSPKPLTLTVEGKFVYPGGPEELHALKTLSLQFNRNGAIFTKGLATCTIGDLKRLIIETAVPRCREAIVGHGKAEIEVRLPEQLSFRTEGSMQIYNGAPKARRPELIYSLYADAPAPTTFFASGVIGEARGRFGTKTTVEIPAIHGGEGLLTGFEATIGKTWLYQGKKVSLLSARCPKGKLLARDELKFIGGYRATGQIVRSCG